MLEPPTVNFFFNINANAATAGVCAIISELDEVR